MLIVNGRFLTKNITGVERFAIEISLQLNNILNKEIMFIAPKNIVQKDIAKKLNIKIVGNNRGHLWEQFDLPKYLKKNGNPLLLNLTNTAPLFYNNNAIVLHDIAFERYPKTYSFAFRNFYKFLIPKLLKKSKKIFTVSNFSKDEISNYYNIDKNRIKVIYNSVNNMFKPQKEYNSEKYILGVSSLHKQKNFHTLIKAFNQLKNKDIKLYIAGGFNKSFADNNLISDIDKNQNIIFKGRVNDDQLIQLYSNAEIFIFPSLYEGFGIPPLEAQACNTPVIASNQASIPEVCGDSAYYFNPNNTDELTQAIEFLLTHKEKREELIKKGIENLKRFSWEESAKKLVKNLF